MECHGVFMFMFMSFFWRLLQGRGRSLIQSPPWSGVLMSVQSDPKMMLNSLVSHGPSAAEPLAGKM